MNEQHNTITGFLMTCILMLVIGGFAGWMLKPDDTCGLQHGGETRTVVDTFTVIKFRDSLIVRNAPARIVYDTLHDTIISTRPFTAQLDTIIKRDTLRVAFDFPRATFSVMLMQHPDSLQVQRITTYVTQVVPSNRAWWVDALTHFGAGAVGYSLATLNNR